MLTRQIPPLAVLWRDTLLFLPPTWCRNMLAPDPAYDAYVSDAGITGNDDFDIVGNWCCGEDHQPCTNFPIVSVILPLRRGACRHWAGYSLLLGRRWPLLHWFTTPVLMLSCACVSCMPALNTLRQMLLSHFLSLTHSLSLARRGYMRPRVHLPTCRVWTILEIDLRVYLFQYPLWSPHAGFMKAGSLIIGT